MLINCIAEKTNAHTDTISDAIISVVFSPDGTKIVSGSDHGTIKVWELRDQPVGERTFVASKEDQTAINDAYGNGCTLMSINGIAVTSWEEFDETFDEEEGEVKIKVWDSGVPQSLQNHSSLAKTDACWIVWQASWSS